MSEQDIKLLLVGVAAIMGEEVDEPNTVTSRKASGAAAGSEE